MSLASGCRCTKRELLRLVDGIGNYGFEGGVSIIWDTKNSRTSWSIVNFNKTCRYLVWSLVLCGSNEVYGDSVSIGLNTDYSVYLKGSLYDYTGMLYKEWSVLIYDTKVYILSGGDGVVMN